MAERFLQAKTDEERFVALLLAAKEPHNKTNFKQLFIAAHTFIARLMKSPPPNKDTSSPPNKETHQNALQNPFQTLALSILAAAAADHKVIQTQEFIQTATLAAPAILQADNDAELEDCLAFLQALVRQPAGLTAAVLAHLPKNVFTMAILQKNEVRFRASCSLFRTMSDLVFGSAGTSMGRLLRSKVPPIVLRDEFVGCIKPLANSLKESDPLVFDRLAVLLVILRTIDACEYDEALSLPSDHPVCDAMRQGLGSILASKVSPLIRADAIHAATLSCSVLGSSWIVGPSPIRATKPCGERTMVEGDGLSGDGNLLSILLQLASIELAMCLHDQPADDICDHVILMLPFCCALLEEATFRLHADEAVDMDEPSEACDMTPSLCWIESLTDTQLVTAQQAILSAVRASLDYAEALRSEAFSISPRSCDRAKAVDQHALAPSNNALDHILAPSVFRFVVAWMVQPSSPTMLKEYDRACSLVPTLRAVAGSPQSDSPYWVHLLHTFKRAEQVSGIDPQPSASADENMAQLFSKVFTSGAEDSHLRELVDRIRKTYQ